LLSRASRECYRIFDIDLEINPVPFEVFKSRIHPDDYPALEIALTEAVGNRSPFHHEYRVVHRNGTVLHVVAVGQFDDGPSGDVELEGIITDVTDRKAAEQALADVRSELTRAVRLASVGELAGSIIHEINQPLTGIMTSAEAGLRWLERKPERNEARNSILRVIEQVRRATDVIAGLRSLVQHAPLNFVRIDINEAVEEVLLLLKGELDRTGITLRADLDRSLPNIEADRVQLQQVILNLTRNAIDAMACVEGRSRVLTASSKAADHHVSVAIADTGPGIDPANRERLFDPFFTTKGSGLGLGLPICRKIVTVHGGRLWVEENKTFGTTFILILPLCRSIQISGRN
jgi:C4-dicarboxylate-specific signal transduction histidine kinase